MPRGIPTPTPRRCGRAGCPNELKRNQKKFCSNSCRATARHEREHALTEAAALEEIRATVQPVVREALTEDVLRNLRALVELVPEAVKTLGAQLASADEDIRHKAAALLLRYTVGNTAVAPAPEAAGGPTLNVVIGAGMEAQAQEHVDPEAINERECLECHTFKPADQFVGDSHRCLDCHDAMLASVRESYGDLIPSAHGAQGGSEA